MRKRFFQNNSEGLLSSKNVRSYLIECLEYNQAELEGLGYEDLLERVDSRNSLNEYCLAATLA